MNLTRPSIDDYFMNMVFHVASRGSCRRRKTGCILVNDRGQVLSTGYNGRYSGAVECLVSPCEGADAPSGESLDKCEAIHAEANALLQCKDVYEIDTAYVTTSPCIHCIKLLLNTSCEKIVFAEEYPHSKSKEMWINSGRHWQQSNHITSYSDALQTVNITSNVVY